MQRQSDKVSHAGKGWLASWIDIGPRYLPFADVATPDLPLSRPPRLSLFRLSVGMALVLLLGTLSRVMIVELDVPAWPVDVMLAMPAVVATRVVHSRRCPACRTARRGRTVSGSV